MKIDIAKLLKEHKLAMSVMSNITHSILFEIPQWTPFEDYSTECEMLSFDNKLLRNWIKANSIYENTWKLSNENQELRLTLERIECW